MRLSIGTLVLGGALLIAPCTAMAGPPYVTDDPEPTETGHWENYGFAQAEGPDRQAGLDINIGAAKDLQLSAIIPLQSENSERSLGLGQIVLGAKYRFVHQDKDGWAPDLAVFPTVILPTGRFADGHTQLFLPVWGQKDFSKWSVFGGGGYTINPGADRRNFWLTGLAVTREVTDKLTIGPEVYYQSADRIDAKAETGVNLGVEYKLTEHWSVIAAGGPQWEGPERRGFGYIALKSEF